MVYGNSLTKNKETRHQSRFTRILCFSEFHAIIRAQASQSISSILIAEGPGSEINEPTKSLLQSMDGNRRSSPSVSSNNRARNIERFLSIRNKDEGAETTAG